MKNFLYLYLVNEKKDYFVHILGILLIFKNKTFNYYFSHFPFNFYYLFCNLYILLKNSTLYI